MENEELEELLKKAEFNNMELLVKTVRGLSDTLFNLIEKRDICHHEWATLKNVTWKIGNHGVEYCSKCGVLRFNLDEETDSKNVVGLLISNKGD